MYSGDEVGALVADLGTHVTRVGFAGEDVPRRVVRVPVAGAGAVGGPMAFVEGQDQGRFDKTLTDMCVDAAQHPILMACPASLPDDKRVRIAEVLLEKYNTPACFLCRDPVLSAFASGRSTALVIDVGASGATVAPVFEGYTLLDSTRFSVIAAARDVTQRLDKLVGPITSLKSISRIELIEEIKHNVCRAWRIPPFDATLAAELDPVEYTFPDGTKKTFGPERFEVCEQGIIGDAGLVQTIVSSFNAMDPDVRRPMVQEIIMVGGGSFLDGLPERVASDLTEQFPQSFKPKLSTPGTTVERKYSTFVGGSVLASLGSFQQMWCSKKEWLEYGGVRCVAERFVQ